MENEKPIKVYVPVEVLFSEDGRMRPHIIIWEDGRQYEINKITEIRPAAAQRAGGQGDRYTIWLNGCQTGQMVCGTEGVITAAVDECVSCKDTGSFLTVNPAAAKMRLRGPHNRLPSNSIG